MSGQPVKRIRKPEKERRFLVGIYLMGWERVDVYVDYDLTGGWIGMEPQEQTHGLIYIGFNSDNFTWETAVDIFLHETAEYLHVRLRTRFQRSEAAANSHGGYFFFFDHEQFSELCARQGQIVAAALPDLSRRYKEYLKEKG